MTTYLDLNKTHSLKKSEINESWYVIDAMGVKLGQLASEISKLLRGKYSPQYTRNMNMEVNIIVINSDKIFLAEKKWDNKMYYRHTQRTGGLRERTAQQKADREGTESLVRTAVRRMMQSNVLRRYLLKNLYVYSDDKHNHQAQKPQILDLSINRKMDSTQYKPVYRTKI